jgi:hypothetical protein
VVLVWPQTVEHAGCLETNTFLFRPILCHISTRLTSPHYLGPNWAIHTTSHHSHRGNQTHHHCLDCRTRRFDSFQSLDHFVYLLGITVSTLCTPTHTSAHHPTPQDFPNSVIPYQLIPLAPRESNPFSLLRPSSTRLVSFRSLTRFGYLLGWLLVHTIPHHWIHTILSSHTTCTTGIKLLSLLQPLNTQLGLNSVFFFRLSV